MGEQSGYRGTVVVVPTRNRAALAAEAARSALGERAAGVRVMVSDNSTSADEAARLSEFCRGANSDALDYVRPPDPLSMTAHWDWAVGEAMRRYDASHFVYLTDRSIFRPGELAAAARHAAAHPDRVVSFSWLTVYDHMRPIRVEQKPFTGRLVEVSSGRLLELSARAVFPDCLPRMMTCLAPRAVVEAVRARFGAVFASASPDYNFCYRCLELCDSILYYDQAVFVSYAIERSNGSSVVRGVATRDNADFLANLALGESPRNFAAPVPAFETVANYIVHEYCLVRRETGSPKFPEVDRAAYLSRNAREMAFMENPERRRETEALLRAHGYKPGPGGGGNGGALSKLRARLAVGARVRGNLSRLGLAGAPGGAPAVTAADETFETVGDALTYAARPRPAADATASGLDWLRG